MMPIKISWCKWQDRDSALYMVFKSLLFETEISSFRVTCLIFADHLCAPFLPPNTNTHVRVRAHTHTDAEK